MNANRLIIILIVSLIGCLQHIESTNLLRDTPKLINEWTKQLAEAGNKKDSITALYNLYDLSQKRDSGKYSTQIYRLAGEMKDYTTQLDILRSITDKNVRNDSILQFCLNEVKKFPDSYDQRETLIYIEVQLYLARLNKYTIAERQKLLPTLIEGYSDDTNSNIYVRTLKLYKIAMVLGYTVGGDLYSDYMDRLQLLIEHLPKGNGSLKSLFYTQSAIAYSLNSEFKKAVKADRQLLSIIDALRTGREAKGRPYHNFDSNLYLSYRRMLGNFPSLSKREIQKYNDTIQKLVSINSTVRSDFESNRRAEAYYLFASGQYEKALPVLKSIIDHPQNEIYRRKLLRMLIESARISNDKNTLLSATTEYNKMLEEYLRSQIDEKVRDMQVFFEISDIKDDRISNISATAAREKSSLRTQLIVVSVSLGIVLVIAIALAGILRQYRKRLTAEERAVRDK